jgi:hypothetical protein
MSPQELLPCVSRQQAKVSQKAGRGGQEGRLEGGGQKGGQQGRPGCWLSQAWPQQLRAQPWLPFRRVGLGHSCVL